MIEVESVEAEILNELIKFAYTGEITLSNKNVKGILQAADFLQMKPATELCIDFIEKHLSVYNVVECYFFAKHFMGFSLLEKTKSFLYKHFGEVVDKAEQEFLTWDGRHASNYVSIRIESKHRRRRLQRLG